MAEATDPKPPEDPFDLGDTSLQLKPRDPETGRFLPPDTAEPKTKHPAHLVERATELGIPSDEIEELSTSALDRQCWRLMKQQNELRASLSRERDVTNPTPKAPADPVVQPTPEPEEDFDGDEWDPRLLKQIKYLRDRAKKIDDMEKRLAGQEQYIATREARSVTEILDAAFERLGEKYQRIFGEGGADELAADSKEMKRRKAVLQDAGIDTKNIDRRTIVKKLQEAADALYQVEEEKPKGAYGEELDKPNGKPRISTEQWNNGAVAKPSGRQTAPEPKGREKAIKTVTEKLREDGIPIAVEKGDTEILDTLL